MTTMRAVGILLVTISLLKLHDTPAYGQAVLGPSGPYNPEKRRRDPAEPVTYRLTVTPAPEPDPPLTYTLYPRGYERTPGNAATLWYRAILHLRNQALSNEQYRTWFTDDLSGMPLDEVRAYLDPLARHFETMRGAALREDVDWDLRIYDLRGPQTVQVLLGEFQESRELARVLSLRTRLHIVEGDFGAALEDMQTAFRLGADIAEPETIINDLIGIAIHAITMENVRHFIDAPGSPNLYWALAQLPQPLFDLRPATEAEMTLVERLFPWLADPPAADRTPEQWQRQFRDTLREVASYVGFTPAIDSDTPDVQVDLVLLGLILRAWPGARRDLIAWAWPEDEVDAMPLGRGIALHQQRIYREVAQNFAATMLLPYEPARTRFEALEDQLGHEGSLNRRPWQGREALPLAASLLSAFPQFYAAATRREVTLKATMVVEALRMHLAETGRLPEQLDEIEGVPVPVNPLTHESFAYRLQDETAVLDVPFPYFHQRFEIRVDPAE